MNHSKEILRNSAVGFRQNLKYILMLILIVTLPAALIQVCIVEPRFDLDRLMDLMKEFCLHYAKGQEFTNVQELTDASAKIMLYLGLTVLISSSSLLVQIAVMLMSRAHYERKETVFRDIFDESVRLFPKVWLTQLLSSVLISIGLMLCFLPGILMYFIFYLVPYAVVFSGLWARKGLFVSSLYFRKYRRTVIILTLAGIVYRQISDVATSALFGLFPGGGAVGIAADILLYCLQALLACVPVAIYSGFVLSMPLDFDLSRLQREAVQ